MNNSSMLSFAIESEFENLGYRNIAGIDEAGRGCLAGPVVAGAVIMPYRKPADWYAQVNDSKQLTPLQREFLYHNIRETALAVGVGIVSSRVIDEKGIVNATRMAMTQAVNQLVPPPQALLIDYLQLREVNLPQRGITDGDSLCFSIACASIIAKVARDRMMVNMDAEYPGYGLAQHKGYGTKVHMESLNRLGPCPIHRRTFRPLRERLL